VDIPAKSDYAVRAMLALAELTLEDGGFRTSAAVNAGDGGDADHLATVEQLADRQGLPRKFLEAILRDLRRAGLVRTRRGARGGYSLAMAPSAITIGMILRAVDGPLAEVRGLRPHETSYVGAAENLPTLWVAVRSALREVLDTTTLEQLRTGKLSARVRRLAEAPDAWESR
jgi:Rrf2 family protein